jgi:hypothetical protein
MPLVQLHLATVAGEVVMSHNELACVSVLYKTRATCESPSGHRFVVQRVSADRLAGLPGHEHLQPEKLRQTRLDLGSVLPTVLHLDSRGCAVEYDCQKYVMKPQTVRLMHVVRWIS